MNNVSDSHVRVPSRPLSLPHRGSHRAASPFRLGPRWLCLHLSRLLAVAACLALIAVTASGPVQAAPSAGLPVLQSYDYELSGRVYRGNVGDQSTPLNGVTVTLYCSNNAGDLGRQVNTTTTNAEGWYGLGISDTCEYYQIVQTDLPGYVSVGATAVVGSGEVVTSNWIRYTGPLDGKTLTGNKFWDELPTLSGRVYAGEVGDESHPLPGVTVSLYGANNPHPDQGTLIISTTTNAEGWYGLQTAAGFEYFHIIESDPSGYTSAGATTISGTVRTENWIEYVIPLGNKTWTGNKFWDRAPTLGPDLVVTGVRQEEGNTICFQIQNIGGQVIPPGHRVALLIDEAPQSSYDVNVSLEPEQRLDACFGYVWSCTPPEDGIVVRADADGDIVESDETNNALEEVWPCDTTPLEITSGPVVHSVTPNSALVSWETNKAATSVTAYGPLAHGYASEMENLDPVMSHTMDLVDLAPATTYHMVVRSTDAAGNTAESRDITFQTPPVPDGVNPGVTLFAPALCRGTVIVAAQADDNEGVEKVEFYLNNELVFTDYSLPYEFHLDTRSRENGEYTLRAKAYDWSGRSSQDDLVVDLDNIKDIREPTVTIISPTAGQTVSGKVNVVAQLNDDTGLAQAYLTVNGAWEAIEPLGTHPLSTTVTFEWDTTGLTTGQYTLGVQAYDVDTPYARWGDDSVQVTVTPATPVVPPKLKVTRSVTRYDNYFAVNLSVANVGGQTATDVEIWDYLKGFQPISQTLLTPVHADYAVEYDSYKKEWLCRITSHADIPAMSSRTYTYFAVPVLLESGSLTPAIGILTGLHYDEDAQGLRIHDWIAAPAAKTWGTNNTIAQEYDTALKKADYLIVTHPNRLFAYNVGNTESVYSLLSEMARLARNKSGVLGFMDTYSGSLLRKLIQPSPTGMWANKLHADFSGLNGYMLIVGETEIIPAWNTTGWDRHWSCSAPPCQVTNDVHDSDHTYADRSGGDGVPDLIVGRIIGNTATRLAAVIRTSNQVYEKASGHVFDRSHALAVSGTGNGQDLMVNTTSAVATTLTSKSYSVSTLHWKDYTSAQRLTEFANRTSGRDVIYIFDHGNADCLGEVCSWDMGSIAYGTAHPFILAPSCTAGNYEVGDDVGVAEEFLFDGVAAYFGSTELSPMSHNAQAGKDFYKNWDASESIGKALTDLERSYWGSSKWWRFWVTEYNLYGDPKYGMGTTTTSAGVEAAAIQASSMFSIEIPDYEVTSSGGVDYVTIPGGGLLLEPEKPQVPYYSIVQEYPAGVQIQGVYLTGRSGSSQTTGLDLPVTVMDITSSSHHPSREPGLAPLYIAGWFPEQDFQWRTLDNADGSTTLIIDVYAFRYHMATTDVEFFKDYTFEIEAVASPVTITSMTTDADAYPQGDPVAVDILIANSAEPRDVVVSVLVKEYGSGETVDSLLLSTLQGMQGAASFSPSWESSGFDAGYYVVEATLQDNGGLVLDKQSVVFRLGVPAMEVTSLTATPELFKIGDGVQITMDFQNTGGVPITGTAVIQVQDAHGMTAEEFRFDFASLQPGQTLQQAQVWDSSGWQKGAYTVRGYVLYDSETTSPAIVHIDTEVHIYLPAVLKLY